MPRQCRANGNLGRLQIPNLPDHDDVRVLPKNVAKTHREGQPDIRPHRDLVDALQFVFDRLLDRDDALVHRVDRTEKGVKRGGLAGAGRTGDQHDAVRFDHDLTQRRLVGRFIPELVQAQEDLAAHQQAQRDALAVHGRHGRNADVDLLAANPNIDAAILRQALLGDVHAGHHLDAGNDRGLVTLQLRRQRNLVQNAVNAVPNAQLILGGFEMNVRRALIVSLPDDLVDELDDARLLIVAGDLLVDVDFQLQGLVLGQLVQRFRTDAVILLQRLLNLDPGRERELHRTTGVELHRVHEIAAERVAHGHLQGAVFELHRHHRMLERDLRRDPLPGVHRDVQAGQIHRVPAELFSQPAHELVRPETRLTSEELQHRVIRARLHRHAPILAPLVKLGGTGDAGSFEYFFDRDKRHCGLRLRTGDLRKSCATGQSNCPYGRPRGRYSAHPPPPCIVEPRQSPNEPPVISATPSTAEDSEANQHSTELFLKTKVDCS